LTSCANVTDCQPFPPPPAARLQDVPIPPFRGKTNDDLMSHVLDLREAIKQSNLDKAALRKFYAIAPE
jgi:hypothetical protein